MPEEEKEEEKEEESPTQTAMDTTIKTPFIADIDYLYDFSSIFANPEQEKRFITPYSDYTDIDNFSNMFAENKPMNYNERTNELIRLLGGKA